MPDNPPPPLRIDGVAIGDAHRVFVIAEIGVNHDGSADRAIELVHAAKAAGADAVKLQMFRAERLVGPGATLAGYQAGLAGDAAALLRPYELGEAEVQSIVREARSVGIIPLATPFNVEDVAAMRGWWPAAVKIASPDLVNPPLLEAAASLGVPMLVSTGAADEPEIADAVVRLRRLDARVVLLHCVSAYPTPERDANLRMIHRIRSTFGLPVGYSDHTTAVAAGGFAVAAGACVVEKHLTYDRHAFGPDHAASADPTQFAEYVRLIRLAETMRGVAGPRRVLDVEADVRRVARQTLVWRRPLIAGAVVTPADIATRRCGGAGVPAAGWGDVIGRSTARDVQAGQPLDPHDLTVVRLTRAPVDATQAPVDATRAPSRRTVVRRTPLRRKAAGSGV